MNRPPHPRKQIALDYPLATGISMWSIVMGSLALLGLSPSQTISQLPSIQATAWGVGTVVASITTLWGLFRTRDVLTVSRGMFLHAFMLTTYWISVLAANGFYDGVTAASFLAVMALAIAREGFLLRRRATGVRR